MLEGLIKIPRRLQTYYNFHITSFALCLDVGMGTLLSCIISRVACGVVNGSVSRSLRMRHARAWSPAFSRISLGARKSEEMRHVALGEREVIIGIGRKD